MPAIKIADEQGMLDFGQNWIASVPRGRVVYLSGDLGAGKTTLVRGALYGLGHSGVVTSPTYTIVETYEFDSAIVFHFDLYRLNSPEELEMIGIRDMLSKDSIFFIEWPDRGSGFLPPSDYNIDIQIVGSARQLHINGADRSE